jgi:serine/threonine protein kinase
MEERDVMAYCSSTWITSLHAAFQDDHSLYLVMEYLPGGDLISLLESKNAASLPEKEARFYISELVEAVQELHNQMFAHR